MLGKLLKHDLKSTARVLLPLQLALAGLTILGMVILGLTPFGPPGTLLLIAGTMITYVLTVVALCVITHIYLMVYFYRSLFTHQGYLAFTLPATPWQLLHAKAIAGYFWSLVNTLLTYLSVLLLFASAVGFGNFSDALGRLCTDNLVNTNVTVNGVASQVSITLEDLMGVTRTQLLVFVVALTLVSCFYSIATGYASAAIGQLFARHKVAGTVVTYLIIYFVMQFFYGIISVVATVRPLLQIVNAAPETLDSPEFAIRAMSQAYHPLFLTMLLGQLVVGIALYLAAGIIMNKKVNLD